MRDSNVWSASHRGRSLPNIYLGLSFVVTSTSFFDSVLWIYRVFLGPIRHACLVGDHGSFSVRYLFSGAASVRRRLPVVSNCVGPANRC